MKQYATIIGVVIIIGIATWVVSAKIAKAPTIIACTTEALICPDGSAVGRTGPNCEFAPCPVGPVAITTPPNTSNTLAIGEKSTIRGTVIRVIGPVEDSRCPRDVQCVWAGTVGVHVAIDSYNKDFTFLLDKPQAVGNATITLTGVTPAQRASTQPIQPSEYRFTFSVVPKVVTSPPITSGVSGMVLLGPTCPVERIPPDPLCADRPYATAIIVYRAGSTSAFATGNSNTKGEFKISLPPGTYTLTASGGRPLPRCGSVDVTIVASTYATTTISCDTGIR